MLHEAGMLDAACKSDLIVNGRVNNQSSAASVTAQAHNPDCSALLPVPVPVPTLLTQHKSNTVVLPAVSGLIQLPITGVYQSSSLVSFKACNLSVTQPPHRTEDGLKHSCKLKAAPRTPLSSGESFLWHWVPKAGNITQRKQCSDICWWSLYEHCPRCHTHLDLATTKRSVKRKRCRSWVCRPVFSCTWPSRRNVLLWHMNDCTRGHASGLMGEKQPSLRKEAEGIKEHNSADCPWVRTRSDFPHLPPKGIYLSTFQWRVRETLMTPHPFDSYAKHARDCPYWISYSTSTWVAFCKWQ